MPLPQSGMRIRHGLFYLPYPRPLPQRSRSSDFANAGDWVGGGGSETRSIRYIAHIGWVGKITHHEGHFKACIKHRQWTCKETTRISPGFTWENDYTYNT